MQPVSTRLDDETYRIVRETVEASDEGLADILRAAITKGLDHDEAIAEREQRISELEDEIDTLRNERIDSETRRLVRDTADVDRDTPVNVAIRRVCERAEKAENLQRENDRLHRERRQLLEQREENQELVKFAQEHRSVVRSREERERERESANALKRAWWWAVGRPTPAED